MVSQQEPEPVPSFSPLTSYVALMVTRRCNMSCGYCSVESSPHLKVEPSEADLLDYVRQAAAAGVKSVQITGGEPMLREKVVLRLLRECKRLGIATFTNTNGFCVPMRVLSGALELLFPQESLCYTPQDVRQLKLEAIAQRYLFRVVESPLTLNSAGTRYSSYDMIPGLTTGILSRHR